MCAGTDASFRPVPARAKGAPRIRDLHCGPGLLCTEDGEGVDADPCTPAARRDRVLLVDDHASFRSIARQVLTADWFLVVGEAGNGSEAIRACGELLPDIVVDIQLPDIDGFAVAAALAGRTDPPAVVLVSSRSRADYGSRIEDCGARGYIPKATLTGDALRHLLVSQGAAPAEP